MTRWRAELLGRPSSTFHSRRGDREHRARAHRLRARSLTGDFCSVQAWGSLGPDRYLLDRWHQRAGFEAQLEAIKTMASKFPGACRLAPRSRTEPDGKLRERNRYHGRGSRGAMSRAERDRADVLMAISELVGAANLLVRAGAMTVRLARHEVHREALGKIALAGFSTESTTAVSRGLAKSTQPRPLIQTHIMTLAGFLHTFRGWRAAPAWELVPLDGHEWPRPRQRSRSSV